MRLSIDHRTSYRFSAPQMRLVQMLRLTPEDTHDQTVASWRIDVDCDARLRTTRDGFGNIVTMLYAEGPLTAIDVSVTGEVLTSDNPGVLRGALDPLPARVFCRATPTTEPGAQLAKFAAGVTDGDTSLGAMQAVNSALHKRFKILNRRGDPARTVTEIFAGREANPRDLGQVMVAAARSVGAPARYVSGYCHSGFGGANRPTPHGWAEVWIDGLGWVSFDPCFGSSTDDSYVRVAVGLDAAGAAPVAGYRMGTGREELRAEVSVDTVEE